MVSQNETPEFPSQQAWNIPSQYSMIQPQPQQQSRHDIITGNPNLYAANVYSPDAVSPPAMTPAEAPTNWHESTQTKQGI